MGCTGSVDGSTIGPVPPVIGTGTPIGTKAKNGRGGWSVTASAVVRSQLTSNPKPAATRSKVTGPVSGAPATMRAMIRIGWSCTSTVVVSLTGVGETRRSIRFSPPRGRATRRSAVEKAVGASPVPASWLASAGEVRSIRACAGASTCSPTAGSIGRRAGCAGWSRPARRTGSVAAAG